MPRKEPSLWPPANFKLSAGKYYWLLHYSDDDSNWFTHAQLYDKAYGRPVLNAISHDGAEAILAKWVELSLTDGYYTLIQLKTHAGKPIDSQ